jgi:hypothetical protein
MNKLLTVLIKKLNGVKESSNDVTLDFSGNKESVYEDLLIPLMNLTKSDDLTQLHNNLNVIINESNDSEEFVTVANLLVGYLMDDNKDSDDDSDLYEEFDNLMLNCMAIFNSLNEAINDNNISAMNIELTEYINSKFRKDEPEPVEKEDDPKSDETEKESSVTDKDVGAGSLEIISTKDEVDDDS